MPYRSHLQHCRAADPAFGLASGADASRTGFRVQCDLLSVEEEGFYEGDGGHGEYSGHKGAVGPGGGPAGEEGWGNDGQAPGKIRSGGFSNRPGPRNRVVPAGSQPGDRSSIAWPATIQGDSVKRVGGVRQACIRRTVRANSESRLSSILGSMGIEPSASIMPIWRAMPFKCRGARARCWAKERPRRIKPC